MRNIADKENVTMSRRVLTFGEVMLRLSSPGYTKLFQSEKFDLCFGGSEANVAVSLAEFGVDTQFLTVLPKNDIGDEVNRRFRYFGVDTRKIIFAEGRMGIYFLEKGASQRSSKVIYDRNYSAFSLAARGLFNWKEIFKDIEWFHFSGINLALSDNLVEICKDAVIEAKEMGITISCDINYRKNLWSSQEKAKDIISGIMPFVDVCIANEEDVVKFLGIEFNNSNYEKGEINTSFYEMAATEICSVYGCCKVAITLRESYSASKNGWMALLFDAKDKNIYYSHKYEIQLVDRIGSGDSFDAGLIYSLICNRENQYAVDFAAAASCLKQTIEGDFNRVSAKEVENLMKSGGNGRVIR